MLCFYFLFFIEFSVMFSQVQILINSLTSTNNYELVLQLLYFMFSDGKNDNEKAAELIESWLSDKNCKDNIEWFIGLVH